MTKEQLRPRQRASKKRYYAKHRERLIKSTQEWVERNRARRKAWWKKHYAANRKKYLAKTKAWREANRDRYNEGARENCRRWQRENREKYLESRRKNHYKTKFGITVEQYDAMLEKQAAGWRICGRKDSRNPATTHLPPDH